MPQLLKEKYFLSNNSPLSKNYYFLPLCLCGKIRWSPTTFFWVFLFIFRKMIVAQNRHNMGTTPLTWGWGLVSCERVLYPCSKFSIFFLFLSGKSPYHIDKMIENYIFKLRWIITHFLSQGPDLSYKSLSLSLYTDLHKPTF
jgi:hypothetical protein